MKGARRREPRRTTRIIRLTVIASAIYAVFAAHSAYAQTSLSIYRDMASFGRPDTSLIRIAVGAPAGYGSLPPGSLPASSSIATPTPTLPVLPALSAEPIPTNPAVPGSASETGAQSSHRRFDGRFMRAQHRTARAQSADMRDTRPIPALPVVQPIQEPDPTPAARVPRHSVMTADERRLLRQHIEEAVRDLYKR
jgi:hypothetical protein